MIVSIHQPNYIPWIGYFYKIAKSDIFVYLDDAQFSNEAAHNFNYIKTASGSLRLKIPVSYSFGDLINQVKTKDHLGWKQKHLRTLEINYSGSTYFNEVFPIFEKTLVQTYPTLTELNIAINREIISRFGLNCKIIRSSELNVQTQREKRIIDICLAVGANQYLSGHGAKAYQQEEHFADVGISLKYTDYDPIEYPQKFGTFIPNMSVIDYLFNCGFHWSYIENAVSKKRADSEGNR